MAKDIIYIDPEDEITGIINKLESSKDKVVALVLPKHCSVFLSSINMKLIKKSAESFKKNLVLITSDSSILPLAGLAGIHVAKSLNSKPSLPAKHEATKAEAVVDSYELESFDETNEKPVATKAEKTTDKTDNPEEVIELDNSEKSSDKTITVTEAVKKNRKLKVPDFSSFRIKVFLAIFAFLAITVGWFLAYIILPKAIITIKTDASTVESRTVLLASTGAKTVDKAANIVPATQKDVKKTDVEKVTATGKKDKGTKASGNVRFYNCNIDDKLSDTTRTVPAGTTITDSSNHNFVTQEDVAVPPSGFAGGSCKFDKASVAVMAIAANAGGEYNLSARNYNVAGFSTITAKDSDGMGGGTSSIVTVIANEDIESAKQKLANRSKSAAIDELNKQLSAANLLPILETFNDPGPTTTTSAAVGAEASDVTVTSVTTYSMLGVSASDLKSMVEAGITKQITDSKQKILDNGLSAKKLSVIEKKSIGEQKLNIETTAVIGPDIDKNAVAKETAGKRRGDIQTLLSSRAGIKDVTVKYTPFWVFQTPKSASKIVVNIESDNVK